MVLINDLLTSVLNLCARVWHDGWMQDAAVSATTKPVRCCGNRKCVVGALTSVVLVAMIVAGVLVAIKLTNDADIERLKV